MPRERPLPPGPPGACLPRRRRGFTLIELLVVMAVIAILAGILVPIIASARRNAKIAATRNLLSQIGSALNQYSDRFGRFPPDSLAGGNAAEALYYFLATPGLSPDHPYIELQPGVQTCDWNSNGKPEIADAWQRPIQYKSTNPTYNVGRFDLWSWGPDGVSSGDDLANW